MRGEGECKYFDSVPSNDKERALSLDCGATLCEWAGGRDKGREGKEKGEKRSERGMDEFMTKEENNEEDEVRNEVKWIPCDS